MFTDSQTKKIKELLDNKKLYISLITDKFDREDAYDLYGQFSIAFEKYYNGLQKDIASRTLYGQALSSHKVNPYLAGGAAQGVAGLGAGLFAASQTVGRNAKIDADRNKYRDQVQNTSSYLEFAEEQLWKITVRLDKFLESIDSVREYRNNKK